MIIIGGEVGMVDGFFVVVQCCSWMEMICDFVFFGVFGWFVVEGEVSKVEVFGDGFGKFVDVVWVVIVGDLDLVMVFCYIGN